MLRIAPFKSDAEHVIPMELEGEVTSQDFANVLSVVEQRLEDHDTLRLYIEIHSLGGMSASALFNELKDAIKRWDRFDKLAVVTDVEGVRTATTVMDKLAPRMECRPASPRARRAVGDLTGPMAGRPSRPDESARPAGCDRRPPKMRRPAAGRRQLATLDGLTGVSVRRPGRMPSFVLPSAAARHARHRPAPHPRSGRRASSSPEARTVLPGPRSSPSAGASHACRRHRAASGPWRCDKYVRRRRGR